MVNTTGNRPSKRTRFSGPDCRVGELLEALYFVECLGLITTPFFTLQA